MTLIPRLIHQLWIGHKPAPKIFMDTWSASHPDFQYLFWSETDLDKLYRERRICATSSTGEVFEQALECIDKIISMEEINGKADIVRWEILYHFGGVFLDADSICVKPFDDLIMNKEAFAGFESEKVMPGLIATGTMGFPSGHALCRAAIDFIIKNEVANVLTGKGAWQTVGPGLLTVLHNTGLYNDVFIFPSWTFLPIHHTGFEYTGHAKVYAYQAWGSTHSKYEVMNAMDLPPQFEEPDAWVSVLVCSYNTKLVYVLECLASIKAQQGHFGIELVWINDGSSEDATRLLEKALLDFDTTTRFCKVVYRKMEVNRGVSFCLNVGVLECTHELVVRHDSDDIMLPHRIKTQIAFMQTRPECVIVGSNVDFLNMDGDTSSITGCTDHPVELTWETYQTTQSHWFMNHPSLLFKRSAVLSVGNYSDVPCNFEDLQLELKLLKRYGKIYNIKESLVQYRLHPDQVTYAGRTCTPKDIAARREFINSLA